MNMKIPQFPNRSFWKLSLYLCAAVVLATAGATASEPRHAFSPDGIQPRVAPEFAIAAQGKALVPVTISPEASEETKAAAEMLAGFLRRISGAEFQIQTSKQPQGITLGTLTEFPDPSLDKTLAIGDWNDGREAFAIRCNAEGVRLVGGSDLGARHAAYRFLELLGVRRYFAGPQWEIVPSKPDLAFDAEEESRPAVLSRRLWTAFGRGTPEMSDNMQEWERHNRMDHSLEVRNLHVWQNVYKKNKEEFDANKETYFAMMNGKRDKPGKYNLANPRVRELLLQNSLDQLNREDGKKVEMISIEPSDGPYWDESPENAALGTISDRAFGVANDLAKKLDEIGRSDIKIGVLAYYMHADPPSFDLDPRINVMLATTMFNSRYDLPKLKKLWKDKTKNLGIYDYYSTYVWGQERLRDPGSYFPAADPERVAADLDEYINELGVRFISAESLGNWALYGPGYYVAVHKMWNPRASVPALLGDFYKTAFGPAEKEMRSFYELLYPSSGRLINYDTLRRLHEKIDAAAKAAKGDAAVLARINSLKQYLHGNTLAYRRMLETDEAKQKELGLSFYTLAYRTKDSQMMATVPILMYTAPNDKALGLPPVKGGGPAILAGREGTPWSGQPPMTDEETEAAFREDLEFFRKTGEPVEARKFSGDLVAVTLSEEDRRTGAIAAGGESGCLTFLSKDGSPVTVEASLGAAAGRPEGFEVSYEVLDSQEKVIASGTMPAGKSERTSHSVKIDLPGPGVYRFHVPHALVSVAFHPDTTAPSAIVVYPEIPATYTQDIGEQPLFFYVPKGTREIVAHVGMSKDRKVSLVDSSGAAHQAEGVFGIARIPVPDGEDGKLWKLGAGQKVNDLVFYNIPSIYSLDAKQALLPREVAQADGLPLVP